MVELDPRLVLEATDTWEDQLTVAIEQDDMFVGGCDSVHNHKGKVCISVAEEKAVGSYNQHFECSIHLTDEQARTLRDWLIANVKD